MNLPERMSIMTQSLTREELKKRYEKKLLQQERLMKRIAYLQDRVTILDKCDAELCRAARTHRLCTRGGMLERELGDPELLTDVQVEELIRLAFAHEDVRQSLREMLTKACAHPEATQL